MSPFKKNKLSMYEDEYLLNLYEETKKALEVYDVRFINSQYNNYLHTKNKLENKFYILSGMKINNYEEKKLKPSKLKYKPEIDLLIEQIDNLNDSYANIIIDYQTIQYLYEKLSRYKQEIKRRNKKNKNENIK